MNKELIKTYKDEFNHWLNGGSLLYRHFNYIEQEFTAWEVCNAGFSWNSSGINCPCIIINDEYSTYRKALAEGKSIQMLCRYDKMEPIWDDMTEVIKSIGFVDVKENYRIKPEEPKFKVGDWVVEIHSTTKAQVLELFGNQIRVKFCYPDAIITTDSSDFIPWAPKSGDWCWFLNKGRIPMISQFHSLEIDGNRKYSATFPNTPHPMIGYYEYCEPFIGNLPTLSNK